ALGALALVLVLVLDDGGNPGAAGAAQSGTSGSTAAVRITAVHDYDPFSSDHVEHPEDVPKATDGDPGTFWTTETYSSFDKPGVGIVLDAGRPRVLVSLTVLSDEPGWTARIRASASPLSGFRTVSAPKTASSRTTF